MGPSSEAILSAAYPASHKVYINSIVGFSAILPAAQTAGSVVGTGTRLPNIAIQNAPASLEQAQLVQCLLGEDPSVIDSPLQIALREAGLVPVAASNPAPVLDQTAAPSCP